jgi:peptidoglycan/LPS O-acetylase OafA/YrhL
LLIETAHANEPDSGNVRRLAPLLDIRLTVIQVLSLVSGSLRKLRDDFVTAYSSRYYPLGYTAALDGLRGVMVFGVVLEHIRHTTVPGAYYYMDIFFVMSAYFITSLLLRDIERFGGIRFLEFYRRRFSRILPAFVAMVGVVLLWSAIARFGPQFAYAATVIAIALGYFSNWWIIINGQDLYNIMGHTWSLSVEEQFYLVWPATVALLARLLGIGRRTIAILTLAAMLAWAWRAWATFAWATATDASFTRLYFGTDMHADAFFIGAALAIWLSVVPPGSTPRLERLIPSLAWPILICGLAISFFSGEPMEELYQKFHFELGVSLFAVLPGALLIFLLVRSRETILHKIFELAPVLFLGRIFYGLYLWHFPIVLFLYYHHASVWARLAIGLPLSLVFAVLSYIYIEEPFMRRRPGHRVQSKNGSAVVREKKVAG